MASREELLKMMRAKDFVENNGEVMRALNVDYIKYKALKIVRAVLPDMTDMDFLKCINYLQLKEYILVRHIKTHELTEIADAPYTELEAKLSQKGIELSGGFIADETVPM